MTRWLFGMLVFLFNMSAHAQDTSVLFAAKLTGLDEHPVAVAQWKGKPLIVNFWARWCGPCKKEIPELIALHNTYRGKGVEVLGIAIEDKAESVRDFAKAYDMDYPLLLARDQGFDLMKSLGNQKLGLPFTVAIDRAGRIVFTKLGGISHDELVTAAEATLK
jgi:thiol-disulfide isomerase/thioredoxin